MENLFGYKIPQGYNAKTEGLSIRYGSKKDHIITILDSEGQETPLLKMKNVYENKNSKKPIPYKVLPKDSNDKIKMKRILIIKKIKKH